jgi:ATP-dependent RNA helicase RhlE
LSLVSADEGKMLAGIERLIKKQLPRKEIEGFEPKNNLPLKPKAKADPSKARNRRPQGGAGKSFGPKPAGRSGGRGRGGQGDGQGRGQGQGRSGRPAQRQSA